MWASIFVLLHTSAANAILISDYMITALSASPISMDHSHHLRKAIAVLTITIAVLIDYFWGKIGRRLNNAVAVFKLGFLAFIILTGFVVFGGAKMRGTSEASGNLDNAFYGQTASPYLYGSAFSSITYSFQGWEVANYVSSQLIPCVYPENTHYYILTWAGVYRFFLTSRDRKGIRTRSSRGLPLFRSWW